MAEKLFKFVLSLVKYYIIKFQIAPDVDPVENIHGSKSGENLTPSRTDSGSGCDCVGVTDLTLAFGSRF
jgi:hypothetical protein